jgi:hypothetical protein
MERFKTFPSRLNARSKTNIITIGQIALLNHETPNPRYRKLLGGKILSQKYGAKKVTIKAAKSM